MNRFGKMFLAVSICGNFVFAQNAIHPQQVPDRGEDYHSLIFSTPPVTNLKRFSANISYSVANFHAWNGSYWPFYRGSIAYRYNDRGWPKQSKALQDHYQFYMYNPSQNLVDSGNIDALSPSEKYDLIVGNTEWNLTRKLWSRVNAASKNGELPIWFGICHGWSAATHMQTPEPLHNVVVSSADGQHSITMFPSDIKALIAHLWAVSSSRSIVVGRSCGILSPEKDEFGRIANPRCFDTNPMTWHLSVLNKLGREKQGFIMDSSSNAEKWNYTLDSYFFRYFSPLTLKPSRSWEDALIPTAEYVSDPFKSHRSPDAVYILGVMMDAFYPIATEPDSYPSFAKVLYNNYTVIYDLELDANHNIIGGEWRSDEHPDFLWTFPRGVRAVVSQDSLLLDSWDGVSAMNTEWSQAAQVASQSGRVLGSIVDVLIKKSREE